jgi:hypothetical protein
MKTAPVYVIYDPLIVSLSMLQIAGSTTQKKSNLDGTFDPDRSTFPLILKPILKVSDPNSIITQSDQTSNLIDCRWYIGTNDQGTRINADTSGYTLMENGMLQINVNVEPTNPISLFFTCSFIDSRTKNVYKKTFLSTLSTDATTEVNLHLEIDAANIMPISPFKSFTNRTITATFRNGENIIPDASANYQWQVLDGNDTDGWSWRAISDDDIFYVSGQNTKSIVVDRSLIDKETIRCQAYHTAIPDKKMYAQSTMVRKYGQWDYDEIITRGKYYRDKSTPITAKAFVMSEKGLISNPSQYFDIVHYITTNEEGSQEKVIAYGESVDTDTSITSDDPNVQTVFGAEVKERTALRAVTLNANLLTLNGLIAVLQIPQ